MKSSPKKVAKPRRQSRAWGTIRLVLAVGSFITMVATGSAQMLWIGGNRVVTGEGPECMAIRAISGAAVRIHCHKTGFDKVQLVGVEAPRIIQAKCPQEFLAGMRSWWFLKTEMSRARTSRLRLSHFRFAGRSDELPQRAKLYFDEEDVAKTLIEVGFGYEPDSRKIDKWCS